MAIRNPEAALVPNIDVLADGIDQFHWGVSIEAIEVALRDLRARNLNPTLVGLLEGKIARLKAAKRCMKRRVADGAF